MRENNIVFRKRQFIIIHQYLDKYMIVNTNKEFKDGHTHVYGLPYAKVIVMTLVENRVKKRHLRLLKNKNFIESMKRISNEEKVQKIIKRSLL